MNEPIDPILLRGLMSRRASRRDVLRLASASAGAAGLSAALSACGVESTKMSKTDIKNFWSQQSKTGHVSFANWPLYMDVSPENKKDHPTLDAFEKQTGTTVHYHEVIQSDKEFFAKLHPSLASGEYCGYDMGIVQNDQYFRFYQQRGYLQPLDQDRMQNFRENASSRFTGLLYDKDNEYSLPWQAGFTGIAYDPKRTGREITSWQDLADPTFAGKVGMLGNTIDLPNCALLAIGVDPLKSKPADWKKAATWLTDQVAPNVRKFYGQDYISALANGDVWISMAYSGDVFQQNRSGSNLKFVFPKERAMLWVDNMIMFKGAENPVDAMNLMDFYFKPRIAADLTEYVNYISPVPQTKQLIKEDARTANGKMRRRYLNDLVEDSAVFPSKSDFAKSEFGYTPTSKEITDWNHIFQPVYVS